MMDDDTYRLRLVAAFKDEQVVKQLQLALKPLIDPLTQSIQQLMDLNASLRQEIAERDQTISRLTDELEEQKIRFDDLEQHGRKGSIRVFGLPEDTRGTVDEKILQLCNEHMKVRPKLVLEDIEVAHRLGKPPPQPSETEAEAEADDGEPTQPVKPRPIIVKLASRRTKTRLMKTCKNLKDSPVERSDGSHAKVFVTDDLTKRRANLAYQARELKRAKRISDTWTYDSNILVKDNYGRISQINKQRDLSKFWFLD